MKLATYILVASLSLPLVLAQRVNGNGNGRWSRGGAPTWKDRNQGREDDGHPQSKPRTWTSAAQDIKINSPRADDLVVVPEDLPADFEERGGVLHSVLFVFDTVNENNTCDEISGRLHSLSRAAMKEAQFGLRGRWEAFKGFNDTLVEEEIEIDPVLKEFNAKEAIEEGLVADGGDGDGDGSRRELQSGCQASECYIGCMRYSWPRFCACCWCCNGGWRRNRQRRLNEPEDTGALTVSLRNGQSAEELETEIAFAAVNMLEQWYAHHSKQLDCLKYPFTVAVDIDPIEQEEQWEKNGSKQRYWEHVFERRGPGRDIPFH